MADKKDELESYIMALVMIYASANKDYIDMIIDSLELSDASQAGGVDMTSMLNKVNSITSTLKNDGKKNVDSAITNSFSLGYKDALKSTGKSGGVNYSNSQQEVLNQLKKDTYDDLLIATQYMSEASKQFIRLKTSQVMQINSALRQGNKQLVRNLMYQFTESALARDAKRFGFTGIVDAANRRWNLETYAEMVVRTKLTQAHIKGTVAFGEENGYHLYMISSHNAIDACLNWEGEVITVGEKIDGYYSYEELQASGEIWHPNCKHHITPISKELADVVLARRGKRAELKGIR